MARPTQTRALEVAKSLALDRRASIVVVHIVQHHATHEGPAVHPDEDRVKGKLEQIAEQLSNDGFEASLRIVDHVGPQPAHEIAGIARKVRADVIVMGTRGRGAIAGLLLGSVVLACCTLHPARSLPFRQRPRRTPRNDVRQMPGRERLCSCN